MARMIADHAAGAFTVPAEAIGLTEATWTSEHGSETHAAWVHDDGTVMIAPASFDARPESQDGRATGRWVEATTGELVAVVDGVPLLPPWSDATTQEPMTAAELRVVLDWLGLPQRSAADLLGVSERTVRHWLAGAYPIPDGVREEIEAIEAVAARNVGEVVDALGDMREPAVLVYRSDEELWAARPGARPLPASWWRMVVARAVTEVPGVVIAYAQGTVRALDEEPQP